jgi:hypothetical protein
MVLTCVSPVQRSVHSPLEAKAASCRRTPKYARANPHALWTAPVERSDDGAFARTTIPRTSHASRAPQSGVALRLPPRSKTRPANPDALWTAVTCHRFRCTAGTILRVVLSSVRCILRLKPKRRRAAPLQTRWPNPHALWTAPAERSDDGAFARTTISENLPRESRAPKRCRASLATALQNTHGEPIHPVDCGDMSPLSLRRRNDPARVLWSSVSVHSPLAAKAASCRRTPKYVR